jgi:hypothetical protein
MSISSFKEACADFKHLRERGYPEKATLKLVGDRHRLSRAERNTLFRGVIVEEMAMARRGKIVADESVAGSDVGIDWYNVLITVESYLRGLPIFIAEDGIVRDSAAAHGSYRRSAVTARAIEEILRVLRALQPRSVDAFLDAPIPFSAVMAEEMRHLLSSFPCPINVALAHSADYPLKTYAGIVASSDSVILDSARRVIDLPRRVLALGFGFTPPLLRDLYPSQ